MANFDPQLFITNLPGQGARPNLFRVQLTFPAIAGFTAPSLAFSTMAKAASVPPSDLGTIRVNYMGREIKYAGDRTFSDWTIQIINDETYNIRDAFVRWSDNINSFQGNVRNPALAAGPGTYMVDINVDQFAKTDDIIPIKTFTLQGAFPTYIGPMELAWDNKDSFEEFAVTFQYQNWGDFDTTT